jgi:ribosomal protein S18 acetylase RimI-like enzyme
VAAAPAHVEAVAAIGAEAFATSRFHLDPAMPPGAADRIKREWARNCAAGARGAGTLVVLRDGVPAGFLAVLADGPARVIDLVAVGAAHRGRGLGRALVAAFIARFGPAADELRVGTQAANVASLRLYESMGFRVASTAYALHLHT